MESWDEYAPQPVPTKIKGPWYWPLTLVALALVGGLSMLMAFLTAGVPERSPLLMGLVFMVPAGAMFFAAMFMEFSEGAMTPHYTRKAQMLVAVAATLATFLCGLLCDFVYTLGGYANLVKPNVIFVLDDSTSMNSRVVATSKTRRQEAYETMDALLDKLDDGYSVGLIVFEYTEIENAIPVRQMDAEQRTLLRNRLEAYRTNDGGGTNFRIPLDKALDQAESITNGKETRIVLISDGHDEFSTLSDGNIQDFHRRAEACNATISNVSMYHTLEPKLERLVALTGGKAVEANDAETLFSFMRDLTAAEGDMIRSRMTSAAVLSGIMFILEGVIIGVGLTLLLSVQGQMRAQLIISPVMAIIAFVVVKFLPVHESLNWLLEGICLSLLGVVFMRRNFGFTSARPAAAAAQGAPGGYRPQPSRPSPPPVGKGSSGSYDDDF